MRGKRLNKSLIMLRFVIFLSKNEITTSKKKNYINHYNRLPSIFLMILGMNK